MSSVPINLEENTPYPPRYWWTRRIVAACLGILLTLSGAWGLWWRTASARLADEIAAIRTRGEPILPEEFNVPAVPDEENAAEYINAAGAAINPAADSPRSTDMEYPEYLPMSAEWMAITKNARVGNARTLALARQARQYSKVNWKLSVKTPVTMLLLPGLNQSRYLANLIADIALYEHLTGNDAEAIERLRDLFHEADAIDKQPVFLVTHLVSIGIYALGIESLIVIAPGLRLADDPSPAPTTQPVTPATREQVQALIRVMLDRSTHDSMTRTLQGERMAELDTIEWVTGKSVLLKPMYRLDASKSLAEMRPAVAPGSQSNLPAAQAAIPIRRAVQFRWSRMMSDSFMPSTNRFAETEFRLRADAAMAAVVLAARLYQVDNRGQWPPNLAALVPEFLPSVPIDPMSSTGKPLGYIILNNGTRPLVYSVGPDEYDNTANGVVPSPFPKVGFDYRTVDQWRDISRFDPPPPTTMPAGP